MSAPGNDRTPVDPRDDRTPVDPSGDRTPIDEFPPVESLPPGFAENVEDALVGTVVSDRYRVERVMGEGGMGRVYEVSDTTFRKRLVLKTLIPQVGERKGSWQRFLREARAAANVGGPHIVGVSDFGGLPDGRSYYVMEHVDGVTLDALLNDLGAPMPVKRALDITRGIAIAISAAHEAGVVHRDLKPDNVILTVRQGRSDFVKVLDFGLALIVDEGGRITAQGELIGTPYYMSPEQCSDQTVDHRADIYALGTMLYEMLTLELPFDSPSFVEVLRSKLTNDAKRPSSLEACGHIPGELDDLVMKAIARAQEDRFQSAEEMVEALDAIAGPPTTSDAFTVGTQSAPDVPSPAADAPAPAPIASSPDPSVTSSPDPAFRFAPSSNPPPLAVPRRRLWPFVLVGLVLLTVFGSAVLGWLLAHSDEPVADETQGAVREPDPPPVHLLDPQEEPPTEVRASVLLDSSPTGASVRYGENVIGQTPIRIATPELGVTRELRIRAQGYPVRTYVLGAYSASEVTVDLRVPARSAAPVAAPDETTVELDEAAPEGAPGEETQDEASGEGARGDQRLRRDILNPWVAP